jgi:hypothetical protein
MRRRSGQTSMTFLSAQAERIRRIRSVIEKTRLETILKIHLPQLEDLQVLLDLKAQRIVMLMEHPKQAHPPFAPVAPSYVMALSRKPRLVPPTEKSLKKSHSDLNELKRLASLLRQFLVDKFEIDEII